MNKAYYVCECKKEYISDFPYKECSCSNCGKTIQIKEEINLEQEKEIKNRWIEKNKF